MNPSQNYREKVAWLAVILLCFAVDGIAAAPASADAQQEKRSEHQNSERQKHRHTYGPPSLYRPGHRLWRLPHGYRSLRHRRHDYFYHHGVFYRPHRTDGYIVVNAPFGARVRHLPPGHVSFYWRDRPYSYINMTYYLWDEDDDEYVVVKAPTGAVDAMVAASSANSSEVFVYPARGQSDEQRDRDRYECYQWSVTESGYDPAGVGQEFSRASDYRRALTACLEGRGYTVE